MDDFGVVECADYLEYTVYCSDVGEERVAEACAGGCALLVSEWVEWEGSGLISMYAEIADMGGRTAVRPAISIHVKKAGILLAGL